MKGRKPQEFLYGDRIYFVGKGKSGRGDIYGICYVPKEYIGRRVIVELVSKEEEKMIEIVKREYSYKKKRDVRRSIK
jgi:hypothetical protein